MRKILIIISSFLLCTTIAFSQTTVLKPEAIDVLVTKEIALPSDYVPKNLVSVRIPANKEKITLRGEAEKALKSMYDKGVKSGIYFEASSGYRSYKMQEVLYNNYVKAEGEAKANTYSAKAGHSEHQLGLAIDVANKGEGLSYDFGSTEAGLFISKNAHKYGFIVRYTEGKEHITGYTYEPWHLRYVGVELATKLYNEGKTLDEYYSEKAEDIYKKFKIKEKIEKSVEGMFN